MEIKKIRKEIDQIDQNILKLLHRRIKIVEKIKRLKYTFKTSVYQPAREKEIMSKIIKLNKNIFPEKSLRNIYNEIFSASRKIQSELRIGYLGPEATFTHLAALNVFGSESFYIPLSTIKDIFIEIETGYVDFGVVPIENSNEGVVGYTLDLLIEFNHNIINEIYLEIAHNLVSREKEIRKIKTLYAHPQSIAQCRTFIENNLSRVKIIETTSTSEAAKIVSKKRNSAALASRLAADMYKLNIIAENVQDNINNYTRFLAISKSPLPLTEKNVEYKTSIVCGIKDKPGALFTLIKPFNDYRINMTKIESRPTKKKAWEYIFFIDFSGKITDKRVEKALSIVEKNSTYFKILGSYPAGKEIK